MELRKSMVELDKFLNYLKDKDYSLNTINAYKKDLSIFLKFSNNKINVDYNFLRTYLQFLYNKKSNLNSWIFCWIGNTMKPFICKRKIAVSPFQGAGDPVK